jgi:hypothetical protein
MMTKDLIDAALQARDDLANAQTGMSGAGATLQAAQAAKATADQALHDDLSSNGPFADIDETSTPMSVTLYTSQDPDSWNSTPVRSG